MLAATHNDGWPASHLPELDRQKTLYEGGFYADCRWRWAFRDDCRYRRRRLAEVLQQLEISASGKTIFEVGFGTGDLLFHFPTNCTLMGVELSQDAVRAIQEDRRIRYYRNTWFRPLPPDGSLPDLPSEAELAIASHVLEHVPDDEKLAADLARRLAPGGHLVAFVPMEPPGFDPKHLRTYDPASLSALMTRVGLEVVHLEANYHVCSGPFRWMDRPARHSWPALTWLEGVRNVLLTVIPYHTTRGIEEVLVQAGVKGSQALVVARKGTD